jgi:hypothetical protein
VRACLEPGHVAARPATIVPLEDSQVDMDAPPVGGNRGRCTLAFFMEGNKLRQLQGRQHIPVRDQEGFLQAVHQGDRPRRTERLFFITVFEVQPPLAAILKKGPQQLRQMPDGQGDIPYPGPPHLPQKHFQDGHVRDRH